MKSFLFIGNNLDESNFDTFQFLGLYPNLSNLSLRQSKFKKFSTVEPLFNRYQQVDCSKIIFEEVLVSTDGSVRIVEDDEFYLTKFVKKNGSIVGKSGNVIKLLRKAFFDTKHEHFQKLLPKVLSKKSRGKTLISDNIMFCNFPIQCESSRNITTIINAVQVVIHLNDEMRQIYGKEWILLVVLEYPYMPLRIKVLDENMILHNIPEIINTWHTLPVQEDFISKLRMNY